jgi:hypothetical protein
MSFGSGKPSLNVAGSIDGGSEDPLDLVDADVRGRSMVVTRKKFCEEE